MDAEVQFTTSGIGLVSSLHRFNPLASEKFRFWGCRIDGDALFSVNGGHFVWDWSVCGEWAISETHPGLNSQYEDELSPKGAQGR
ncbi:hypothetical protein RISK_006799 [Rhodopirellula islandica]|uniref:Uncharacterized protein n=1 Tax=Rhodopirellula islandica TaxID=595434 RepID=A0A0J1B2T4_RHOIS|nr:hypothetical protein RISK_006799 [Rhodopirellula islandica]